MPDDKHSPAVPANTVARVVVASFIGTTIEWYDFFLYGTAAALVFNKLFFPTLDPLSGRIAAFATYAVGFFARPVGSVVFGHFGDRLGRKSVLVTTLMLMGMSTFLIGVLPTYDRIGIAAPILLVVLRFVQGFGVGGEWGGAVLMVVEHGHRSRRGFAASWVQAGVPAGSMLANAVFNLSATLTGDSFLQWGWRIPFLLGIGLLAVGLFIRLQIYESPLFERVRERKRQAAVPIFEVLRRYRRNVLLAMGARMAENAAYYVFTVFVLSYVTKTLGVEQSTALNCLLVATVVEFVSIPLLGHLSDTLGRRPVYLGGAVAVGAFAFPLFWLLETRTAVGIGAGLTVALVLQSAMYAPQAAFFSELFGTDVRYTGASIGYQLASPLAGGLAPIICEYLLPLGGGQPWGIALYLIALCVVTLVSVALAAETHRTRLEDGEDHASSSTDNTPEP